MSVPAGYQATEVGIIPDDWEAIPLGRLGSFSKGQGIRKDQASSGDIPCVRYGEIYTDHNDVVRKYRSRISRDVASTSRVLRKGDLLFAGSGETKEEIGKCVAFVDDCEAYAGGDIIVLSPHSANSVLLGYLLNSEVIARQKAARAQGDAVVHISAKALADVIAPLPTSDIEQTAIAEALSGMDEAIAAQEAVIAKKRALKTATMQALLSGTRRLPGFTGEWESRPLAALCSMKSGFGITSKSLSDYGPYRCFGGNGFRGFTDRYTHEGVFPLVGRVGALCGNVTLAEGKFFASEHAIVVSPHSDTSALWLAIVLRDLNLNKFSEASAQPVLVVSKLLLIHCLAPPTKDEQEAIASVAMDMDSDIAADNVQLAKLRQVKTGMMQQLLTGKIRLV